VTRGTAARAAAFAGLAAVWIVAAWLLWQSSVVPSLRLPRLDEHRYFSAAQLREAASFGRFSLIDWVLTTLAELVALAVYARKGGRFARESAAGALGTGMLLGMLGFALVWAAQLPFDVAGLWWQRRHHLTHVGYVTEVFGNWLALGGQFVFLCLALAIVMGLAHKLPRLWWAAAAPAFIGLALLFAFINPYLMSTHPLRDPHLHAASLRLERIEHIRRIPIVVEDVHDVTSLPNAEATGLGSSRRGALWDTLLAGLAVERVDVDGLSDAGCRVPEDRRQVARREIEVGELACEGVSRIVRSHLRAVREFGSLDGRNPRTAPEVALRRRPLPLLAREHECVRVGVNLEAP